LAREQVEFTPLRPANIIICVDIIALFNLNPDFGAECQIHSDGVGAVHKPDSGDEL
jgi:hypothetical protein